MADTEQRASGDGVDDNSVEDFIGRSYSGSNERPDG